MLLDSVFPVLFVKNNVLEKAWDTDETIILVANEGKMGTNQFSGIKNLNISELVWYNSN